MFYYVKMDYDNKIQHQLKKDDIYSGISKSILYHIQFVFIT